MSALLAITSPFHDASFVTPDIRAEFVAAERAERRRAAAGPVWNALFRGRSAAKTAVRSIEVKCLRKKKEFSSGAFRCARLLITNFKPQGARYGGHEHRYKYRGSQPPIEYYPQTRAIRSARNTHTLPIQTRRVAAASPPPRLPTEHTHPFPDVELLISEIIAGFWEHSYQAANPEARR